MPSDSLEPDSPAIPSAPLASEMQLPEELTDALRYFSTAQESSDSFQVVVAGQAVKIPVRIYHDPRALTGQLTDRESSVLNCLFTRHCSGYVRERCLRRIIVSREAWVPAFVIPLVGDYVIEILRVIEENLPGLDRTLYRDFLSANRPLYDTIVRRVVSYWDCYYRSIRPADYIGFRLVRAFDGMILISSKGRVPRGV